jgi:tetratricopeptide (TPR) repeat protein
VIGINNLTIDEKLQMSSKNPYVTGYPVGDTHAFVGRADIVREVQQVLKQPNNNAIVLYGQRRIGKTSVLRELKAKLPQENAYQVVLFDLLDKSNWPLEKVLQELAKKISDVLQQEKLELGNNPETAFCEHLADLLNKLSSEQSLVLLFDEFDVLDDPENKNEQPASIAFFPYLRQLLDIDRQRLNFVFVIGRKVEDMTIVAKSFFRTAQAKRISLLEHEDTAQLIRLSETNNTLNWTEKTIEKICQLTNGHPYLTQQFCSRVWENVYDKNPKELPTVTLKEVKAVEQGNILEVCDNALEWLWDGLPPAEKVVASALAAAGPGIITEKQLKVVLDKSGVRMVVQKLHNAPQTLKDWDLIEVVERGYRFRVELLRRWITEYKPLSKVQEELDSIEPVADDLFKAAHGLHAKGEFEAALTTLRQAVTSNPNHVGANLLLADILLARGELKEACKNLERLYTYQASNIIREKLIQALLAMAYANNNEDKQLNLYERVLKLDTDNKEAKTQRQTIWQRRGDQAYYQGDLNGALNFYKIANLDDKVENVTREMERRKFDQQAKLNKKQRRATRKGFMNKYLKGALEFVALIIALVGSYFLFKGLTPKEPIIILEVEPLKGKFNGTPTYSLTGAVSDKPYLLESIKIYPKYGSIVKQASFQYDVYSSPIDLVKHQGAIYGTSKNALQKKLGEDTHFSFKFLTDDRFKFRFQFEGVEEKEPEFECKVFAEGNLNVPCEVKEKGYLSIFRGLPWFVWGTLGGIVLILLIEIIYFFTKRERDGDY